MSKPKQYELKNGKKVEVHTPFTTRAKELMQLYNGLNLPMLTIDERLDVLLHVKWTVKVSDNGGGGGDKWRPRGWAAALLLVCVGRAVG